MIDIHEVKIRCKYKPNHEHLKSMFGEWFEYGDRMDDNDDYYFTVYIPEPQSDEYYAELGERIMEGGGGWITWMKVYRESEDIFTRKAEYSFEASEPSIMRAAKRDEEEEEEDT